MLTGGYAKLVRIVKVCTDVEGMFTAPCELVTFVIQFLEWALRYQCIDPKQLTVEGLDKARDGSIGVVHMCLARLHIFGVVLRWVQDCKNVPTAAALAAELEKLLEEFFFGLSEVRSGIRRPYH